MKNITNIDEILNRYLNACIGQSEIIKEFAKGDWGKAESVYNNHEPFRNLCEERLNSLKDFEHATSGGNIHTLSDHLLPIYNPLVQRQTTSKKDSSNECSITNFLYHIRDEWEDKIKNGDTPDNGIIEAFYAFFGLPNYDPYDWLKRKFYLRGIYISPSKGKNIPESVIQEYKESCSSFIYGNYLATVATARSVLEFSLKRQFPKFCKYDLNDIINSVPELKGENNYREKADNIRRTGNNALHKDDIKILQLINEMKAQTVLNNLKDLIEFIYK